MNTPQQFRKKPIVIEAMGPLTNENSVEIAVWCSGSEAPRQGGGRNVYDGELFIPTLEGTHRASLGDWIIKGVKGEFYPCKPDLFEATYDPM